MGSALVNATNSSRPTARAHERPLLETPTVSHLLSVNFLKFNKDINKKDTCSTQSPSSLIFAEMNNFPSFQIGFARTTMSSKSTCKPITDQNLLHASSLNSLSSNSTNFAMKTSKCMTMKAMEFLMLSMHMCMSFSTEPTQRTNIAHLSAFWQS